MTHTIQTQAFKLQATPEDCKKKKNVERYLQRIFLTAEDSGRS